MKVCLGSKSPLECIYCRHTECGCGSSKSIVSLISDKRFSKCFEVKQNCKKCSLYQMCEVLKNNIIQETTDAISLHKLIIDYFLSINDDSIIEEVLQHAMTKEALQSFVLKIKSMSVNQLCQFINGEKTQSTQIPLYLIKLMNKYN
jgi:hypothetical protein